MSKYSELWKELSALQIQIESYKRQINELHTQITTIVVKINALVEGIRNL